jgi:osmotically-inducible protein OsmY
MKPTFDREFRVDSADADLVRNVRLFLGARHSGFQRIGVRAESGTVRLCGPVGSFFLRQMAIAMAKRVAGVRHVVDDLEVEVPRQVASGAISDKQKLLDCCDADPSPEAATTAGRRS